ncbi:hypothetical protein JEQ12_002942 [Ovis aries]|uniref:Mitotic-spindle organizing protein 1 n=1 Tax=Ovis aries TaxID=9940 RepID=A0A836A196_SHEEP|nr:hypothetical protein JEQ12_002942 [Ovis aries]
MTRSHGAGSAAAAISRVLDTRLDTETLSICVQLCEQGINPEAVSSAAESMTS